MHITAKNTIVLIKVFYVNMNRSSRKLWLVMEIFVVKLDYAYHPHSCWFCTPCMEKRKLAWQLTMPLPSSLHFIIANARIVGEPLWFYASLRLRFTVNPGVFLQGMSPSLSVVLLLIEGEKELRVLFLVDSGGRSSRPSPTST